MEIVSTQKYILMSPRKLRLVANAVRKLSPNEAVTVLPFMEKRAAEPLEKAIKTALANAKVHGLNGDELVFKEIQIGEGPRLKRGRPVSRGRWHPYKKRMSHIRIVLETLPQNDKTKKSKPKSQEIKEESKTKKAKAEVNDGAKKTENKKGGKSKSKAKK